MTASGAGERRTTSTLQHTNLPDCPVTRQQAAQTKVISSGHKSVTEPYEQLSRQSDAAKQGWEARIGP